MKSSVFITGALFFGFALSSWAGAAEPTERFASKYAPHLNGTPWPQFPITSYVETSSNAWVHPLAPTNSPTLQEVQDKDCDFATIVLSFPDGRVFKTYNRLGLGPYLSEVYSGDFNKDGKPDFMAIKPGSGNGIAGEFCTGVFAFSEGDHYRFTRVSTMSLGREKLVKSPTAKKFRFIHTDFRQAEATDGKTHSFWVHQWFAWNGTAFEPDPALEPMWIQYVERPNHEPTKLLTLKMKQASDRSKVEFEW